MVHTAGEDILKACPHFPNQEANLGPDPLTIIEDEGRNPCYQKTHQAPKEEVDGLGDDDLTLTDGQGVGQVGLVSKDGPVVFGNEDEEGDDENSQNTDDIACL